MSRSVPLVLILASGLINANPRDTVRLTGYGQLPLAFEENQGQFDPSIKFLARASGHSILITRDKVILALRNGKDSAAVSIQLFGALPSREPLAESPLASHSNYYQGNDPSKWVVGVRHFGKIRVAGVRPGLDLLYYGNNGQFEYDLDFAP